MGRAKTEPTHHVNPAATDAMINIKNIAHLSPVAPALESRLQYSEISDMIKKTDMMLADAASRASVAQFDRNRDIGSRPVKPEKISRPTNKHSRRGIARPRQRSASTKLLLRGQNDDRA